MEIYLLVDSLPVLEPMFSSIQVALHFRATTGNFFCLSFEELFLS